MKSVWYRLAPVGPFLFVLLVSSDAVGAPVCEVSPASVELGMVRVGTRVEQPFTIHNSGDSELVLKKKSQSCGCEIVSVPEPIAPGGTGKISIAFVPKTPGSRQLSVLFTSNDPSKETVSLSVQYRCVSEVFCEPTSVHADQAEIGQPTTVTLKVTAPKNGNPFRILQARSSTDWIQVDPDFTVPTDASTEHIFDIRLRPTKQGQVRESIILRTSSLRVPLLEIPVRGNISGLYVAEPSTLSLGVFLPNENVTRALTIRRNDGKRFSIISAELEGAALELSPQKAPDSAGPTQFATNWTVTVTAAPPKSRGLWKEELKLRLADESGENQDLSIGAIGFCRSAETS